MEIDVNQLMEAARAEVTQSVVEDVKRRLSYTVSSQLAEEIAPVIREFVKKEIVPELQAQLFEQKGVVLAGAVQAAALIGQGVADKLVKQATDALANSYSRTKIIEAIMGK